VYDIDCDDPNATPWENCDEGMTCDWGETECSELQSCEDQGLVTCWDGSCADSEDDCSDEPYVGQDCCELVDCNAYTDYVGLVLGCGLYYCLAPESEGNGTCDDFGTGQGMNCEYFNFDGGDCVGFEDCSAAGGNIAWLGDGYCDDGVASSANNNIEACEYDGGDCCCMTCADSDVYACETYGPTVGSCLDPDVDATDEEACLAQGGSPESNTTSSRSTFEKENGLKSVNIELTKDQFQISQSTPRVRKEYYFGDRVKRSYSD
jgi:hypothetical protein